MSRRREIEEDDELDETNEREEMTDEEAKKKYAKHLASAKRIEAARQRKIERYAEWSYECVCLEKGCGWKAVWESADTWKKGAATLHADSTGHAVKTTSTKVVRPKAQESSIEEKEPLDTDRSTAYCAECKRYVGVGAGRFFNAAVAKHRNATEHTITIRSNKNYRPEP